MKKIFFSLIIFYFTALLGISFLPHFNLQWLANAAIFLIVVFLNFSESSRKNSGLICAFSAGFFLDVFSSNFIFTIKSWEINFFGFYTLFFLILGLFIKKVLRNNVRLSIFKRA